MQRTFMRSQSDSDIFNNRNDLCNLVFQLASPKCYTNQILFNQQNCDQTFFRLNSTFAICQSKPSCNFKTLHVKSSDEGYQCQYLPYCSKKGQQLSSSCMISSVFAPTAATSVKCGFVKQFRYFQVCVIKEFNLSLVSSEDKRGAATKQLCPLFQMFTEKCVAVEGPTAVQENFEKISSSQNQFQDESSFNSCETKYAMAGGFCQNVCSGVLNAEKKICYGNWAKESKKEYK